jgi:hypothetical protein
MDTYPNDGMTANSQTTGSDMEWQEFYLLNANGTFKNLEKRWICLKFWVLIIGLILQKYCIDLDL